MRLFCANFQIQFENSGRLNFALGVEFGEKLVVQTGEIVEQPADASPDDLVVRTSERPQKLNQLALGLVPETAGLNNTV